MTRHPKILAFLFCLFTFFTSFSQKAQFSLATDLSLFHSFKKDQRYWSIGQTITAHFNFTPTDGVYGWFAYSTNGRFNKEMSATAKSILTLPQQVNYTNFAKLRFSHISLGWKHYLKGAYNTEDSWSLYSTAGFGLLMGVVENTHTIGIDSSRYQIPVWKGKSKFKRLTIDLGLGYEVPVGGEIYFYMEGRAFIPTTDYPSNYLFINENAPLIGSLNGGIRILF